MGRITQCSHTDSVKKNLLFATAQLLWPNKRLVIRVDCAANWRVCKSGDNLVNIGLKSAYTRYT